MKETVVFFSSKKDHEQMTQILSERYKEAKTIPGTLKWVILHVAHDLVITITNFFFQIE